MGMTRHFQKTNYNLNIMTEQHQYSSKKNRTIKFDLDNLPK